MIINMLRAYGHIIKISVKIICKNQKMIDDDVMGVYMQNNTYT